MAADDGRNPQAAQMLHDSMRRTLAAQTDAIWPQERALLDRYPLPADARVLDAGCGTGEFSLRVCAQHGGWRVHGVDLLPELLDFARPRAATFGARLQFSQGDAYALPFAADQFDLACCRHVLQAVPRAADIIAELVRVTRPGGWLHLIAEDYAMLHTEPAPLDTDEFWQEGPVAYTARTATDARIGRRAFSMLRALGCTELSVEYVIVDTQRVPRQTFADIITAWRDGYVEVLADGSRHSPAWFRARFDQVIASILDPSQYAVWFVPVVSGRVAPGEP